MLSRFDVIRLLSRSFSWFLEYYYFPFHRMLWQHEESNLKVRYLHAYRTKDREE